jgi:S-adenosylmethionine decarboxylase
MAPLPPQHDSDANSHEGVPEVIDEKKTMMHVPSGDWNTETGTTLSDDEGSGHMMERDYTGMFEGPEKNLEVVFRKIDDAHIDSSVGELSGTETAGPIQRWIAPTRSRRLGPHLRLPCCTILSSISNISMLTVLPSRHSCLSTCLVLKTCGTTTLLRCITTLIDLGRKLGLEIDWVGYSRKNFNFPGDQAFPHQSFHQELDYLYGHRNLSQRLDGNGYTLGPVNGDHWFVFVADHTLRSKSLEIDTDRVLNIMMFDIDESVSQLFYYEHYERDIDGEDKDDEVRRISREQTASSALTLSVRCHC